MLLQCSSQHRLMLSNLSHWLIEGHVRNAGTICRGSPVGILHAKGQKGLAPAIAHALLQCVPTPNPGCLHTPALVAIHKVPWAKPSRAWAPYEVPLCRDTPLYACVTRPPLPRKTSVQAKVNSKSHTTGLQKVATKRELQANWSAVVSVLLQAGRKSGPASSGVRRVRPIPAGGAFLTL